MSQSNVQKKITDLQEEVNALRASQILGGDNTKVYHRYLEVESTYVRYNSDWGSYWFSEDGSSGGNWGYIAVGAEIDDPFEIVEIEKMEVWRNGKQITGWSGLKQTPRGGYGQYSPYGDSLTFETVRDAFSGNYASFIAGLARRIGPELWFTFKLGTFSDSPATPFRYLLKLWIRTTAISEYKLLGRA